MAASQPRMVLTSAGEAHSHGPAAHGGDRMKFVARACVGALLGLSTFALPAPAQAAGDKTDTYVTAGNMIDIIRHPRVTTATETSVKVRYRCESAGVDVQLGARVSGSVVHSNRFARFGYPFTPAECDGRMHVTDLSLHPFGSSITNTAFTRGEDVTVGVDLIAYGPFMDGGFPSSGTSLAGQRKTDSKIK